MYHIRKRCALSSATSMFVCSACLALQAAATLVILRVLFRFVYHPVFQLGQLTAVPPVGRSNKIARNALQPV